MALRAGGIFRITVTNDYVAHRVAAAQPWWRWSELAAIPIAALSMLTFSLLIAGAPWLRDCNPTATRPLLIATICLMISADLLMAPRREWSRSRNNATMNTVMIGALFTLIFCVVATNSFAWPVLFPLLTFPLSLVLLPAFGIGVVSRFPISELNRQWIIGICLVLAGVLLVLGMNGYQTHIACRWAGA